MFPSDAIPSPPPSTWDGRRRVFMEPEPRRRGAVPWEACFVGHVPPSGSGGAAAARGRAERVSRGAIDALDRVGFSAVAVALRALREGLAAAPSDARTRASLDTLCDLPLRFSSLAEFRDVFPDADARPCALGSRATGRGAWLPRAVEDFFAHGGEAAWIVVVDEEAAAGLPAALERFAPRATRARLADDPTALRGPDLFALLDDAALLCVPDLERLLVPAEATAAPFEPASVRDLGFAPVDDAPVDRAGFGPALEARGRPALDASKAAAAYAAGVRRLLEFLTDFRPDAQLLCSAPTTAAGESSRPLLDAAAARAWFGPPSAEAGGRDLRWPDAQLARLVPTFPYLRSPRYALGSACGAAAGLVARSAVLHGPWRSTAGLPLSPEIESWPPLPSASVAFVRDECGVSPLVALPGGAVAFDDERCPSLSAARSAEVVRLLGYVRRELVRLGRRLVFDVDPRDPRPRYALETFCRELHARGALRGARPEDAFDVRVRPVGESAVAFEIALAPAAPIDRVVVALTGADGRWSTEVRRA